ncbi:MAG: hypothetical protein U9N50_04935 [Pseudomonadota bacterium]|nr:hypothetical protein [Pseudomonadota bacterium]
MKRVFVDWTSALLIFLMFPYGAFAVEDRPFTESVVIFNTICAKCHEAQCSGRLSFDDAFERSTNHILRYYGPASGKQWLQKELFDILNYMKEKCAYYPLNNAVPLKKTWGSDVLEKFSTLTDRSYFLPVGSLSAGDYRLQLELEKDTKATLHLISDEFDMVVEDCVNSSNSRIDIRFSVEDSGNYFFRMYPREPVRITQLSITKSESN